MSQNDFYSDESRPTEETAGNEAASNNTSEKPNGEYRYSYKGYGAQHPYSHNAYSQRYYSPYARVQPDYTAPSYSAPQQKQKRTFGAGAIVTLLIAAIVLSAASGFAGVYIGANYRGTIGDAPTQSGNNTTKMPSVVVVNPDTTPSFAGSYTDVAKAVGETVVEIRTEIVQTNAFFGQYVTGGAGSGVVIAENGLIITNHHVIDGATKIIARLSNGLEYEAKLAGSDAESDIALLKIEATGLAFAGMGNSDALAVGQEIIVIGNPLGELGGSVTNGIVSALDREVSIEGEIMNLLQTNAAVNPGNSGGGLFNLAGELVGIVNAKTSGTGIEGIGFAIPINDALAVTKELSEYGYVRGRTDLGIKYLEVVEITMQHLMYGYTKPGVYVVESPLNTELKSGDRIVAINNVEVSAIADIKAIIREHKIGDTVSVTVVRNNRNVTVTATCYEYVPEGVQKAE